MRSYITGLTKRKPSAFFNQTDIMNTYRKEKKNTPDFFLMNTHQREKSHQTGKHKIWFNIPHSASSFNCYFREINSWIFTHQFMGSIRCNYTHKDNKGERGKRFNIIPVKNKQEVNSRVLNRTRNTVTKGRLHALSLSLTRGRTYRNPLKWNKLNIQS